jgi:hypothetical protein
VIIEGEAGKETEVHYPELVVDLPSVPAKGDRLELMIDKSREAYARESLPKRAYFVVERVDWSIWLFDKVIPHVDVILRLVRKAES